MRILYVQKMAGVAGAERYYESLLPALAGTGHDVHFLCVEHCDTASKNDAFCEHLETHGATIHRFSIRSVVSPRIIWKMLQVIRENSIQILQTNLAHADMWGVLAKPLLDADVKWLSVKHSYNPDFQSKHGMDASKVDRLAPAYLIARATSQLCDHSVAISESLAKFFVDTNATGGRPIQAIPYGFDFEEREHDIEGLESDLVIVGRLVPVKQHKLLFEALALAKKSLPSISLAVVGSGELRESLEQICSDLEITENVTFHGFQTNVFAFLSSSKISVFPSRAEGFGLVLLESWFCKRAVVSFDVPALNELIDSGENGVLIERFDVESMAESFVDLLKDEEYRTTLGEGGYQKYLKHYSLTVMQEKYDELYTMLVRA